MHEPNNNYGSNDQIQKTRNNKPQMLYSVSLHAFVAQAEAGNQSQISNLNLKSFIFSPWMKPM